MQKKLPSSRLSDIGLLIAISTLSHAKSIIYYLELLEITYLLKPVNLQFMIYDSVE
jgi:hypothetical protein